MVCLRIPTHASLPHSGLDLDCFSLWRAQYTVNMCSEYLPRKRVAGSISGSELLSGPTNMITLMGVTQLLKVENV